MSKFDRMRPVEMGVAFKKRFDVEIETTWNIISSSYQTSRPDGEPLSEMQQGWLQGWDDRSLQS